MKIYELELKLNFRKDAKSEGEAKKEMMDWIQSELKRNKFAWRIQLTNTYNIQWEDSIYLI